MSPEETQPASQIQRRYRRYYTYIEPIIADPTVRGYFTLVASILLVAFFVSFALSPTISTILGLTRKISDQKKVITAMDARINALIIAQENYSQAENYLPALSFAYPQRPSADILLSEITKTATASSVHLVSLRVSDYFLSGLNPAGEATPAASRQSKNTPSALGIPLLEFNLSAVGTYSQLHAFAAGLENLPRIITLTTISSNASNAKSSNSESMDLKGTAYYLNISN